MKLPTARLPGRGLRSRIIWTTALVTALAMAVMIGAVILVLNAVTRINVDSKLEDRLVVLSSSIAGDQDGPAHALESPADRIEDSTWLFDSQGQQVMRPRAGERVQAVARYLGKTTRKTSVTRRERVFLSAPVRIRGGSHAGVGVLVVSESLEPYEETRIEVLLVLIALGLLVTAGSTGIAAWTMSQTLAPVEAMAGLADDWSEHDLDARFDGLGSENEITHLGHTLNLLLDRVAGALRGEQRLTSELAHELRTPLSGIRGEAEVALMSDPDPLTRERLQRVVTLVDQMSSTISTLLAIARGGNQPTTRTTVSALIAATLQSTTRDIPHIQIRGNDDVPEHARVNATIDAGVRALAPLVDNAYQHALSHIDFSVRESSRAIAIAITVSDDGPGLASADQAEALFAAGARGPESSGAGLGLPLARRVARTLGGDVSVTSPHAPTSFTLTLLQP
jgi:two-component system, OmpR family, sensor kinase